MKQNAVNNEVMSGGDGMQLLSLFTASFPAISTRFPFLFPVLLLKKHQRWKVNLKETRAHGNCVCKEVKQVQFFLAHLITFFHILSLSGVCMNVLLWHSVHSTKPCG